jgi:site-specific DNA recombinase
VEGRGSDGLLPHASLIKAVARAHVWLDELASGRARTVREIAMKERVDERFVAKHLPWAFVSPPVVEAVLRGDQFGSLSANRLATPGDSLTRWKRIREESSE